LIKFNVPPLTGYEIKYINQVITEDKKMPDDYTFIQKCSMWLEDNFKCNKVFLTSSCTHALEMAALLIDVKPEDEIIMPSFTFPSSANAFILRGAKIVFVDIRPDTLNIDEKLIEGAITQKTKAIVPVHYAGVTCEMDAIMDIASRYNLYVIEDAAQGVMSTYKGKALGTIGHIGCYSFHKTKNYTMGEGGAILINGETYINKAEIIIEKGTDRSSFLRGEIDKYSWVDVGSSYIPAEVNAAYLYAQLEKANDINNDRLNSWNLYNKLLQPLSEKGYVELPHIPTECEHNAHMYYIKCKDFDERKDLIDYLNDNGVSTVFHYIPLHSSKAGKKFSRLYGNDVNTTRESQRVLRLPMYYGLNKDDIKYVVEKINEFYKSRDT